MTDIWKCEIDLDKVKVGDRVAWGTSSHLGERQSATGTIIRFTPTQIVVQLDGHESKRGEVKFYRKDGKIVGGYAALHPITAGWVVNDRVRALAHKALRETGELRGRKPAKDAVDAIGLIEEAREYLAKVEIKMREILAEMDRADEAAKS